MGDGSLLDDLGGLEQDVRGDGEAQGLGRLEVDDQLELPWLLDREVGRLRTLEDAVYVVSDAAVRLRLARSVREQAACLCILATLRDHRQALLRGQRHD